MGCFDDGLKVVVFRGYDNEGEHTPRGDLPAGITNAYKLLSDLPGISVRELNDHSDLSYLSTLSTVLTRGVATYGPGGPASCRHWPDPRYPPRNHQGGHGQPSTPGSGRESSS